jgi:ArsR family transcriptional regulator
MKYTDKDIAKLFKALGDETRIAVLRQLRDGEQCACVLLDEVPVGQSTLSHHMKILVDSGIVNARREGKWTHYSIAPACCNYAEEVIDGLLSDTEETK